LEDLSTDIETFDQYANFDVHSFESVKVKSQIISDLDLSLKERITTIEDFDEQEDNNS